MKQLIMVLVLCGLKGYSSGAKQETALAPAFSVRAFHLDLRIQVMTLHALKVFAEKLHQGGLNTLIMEYEGTYPFQTHPLLPNRYAYTKADIVSFIAYCDSLGIDVIPLQQSFGHVEYILRHERYKSLREDDKDLSQVCPLETVQDSLLFTDLYTELAATHSSPYIHIGCDETHLLGHCPRCRQKVALEGISKLYIDYVRMLCNIVIRLGKRPVLWADIALTYPEAMQSLPKQTVFVDWNYGWNVNLFGNHQKLLESGFEIWGAPALRSSPDNFYLTMWKKHLVNIGNFVTSARQMGYKGMVLTSWSTSGVYAYDYESENTVSGLEAIRHVYPITGFNILLTAYTEALRSNTPLQPDDFIPAYSARQYGFSKAQASAFWQALTLAPYEVTDGVVDSPTPLSLESLADSSIASSSLLHALHPLRHAREFAHYTLMADIRRQHIQFLLIEHQANAPSFTGQQVPDLLRKLRRLLDAAPSLSKRFIELNENTYFPSALQQENQLRSKRIVALYQRLCKIR